MLLERLKSEIYQDLQEAALQAREEGKLSLRNFPYIGKAARKGAWGFGGQYCYGSCPSGKKCSSEDCSSYSRVLPYWEESDSQA